MHSHEANQARETISKAVVQDHMRSIKSKQQLMRSNSLNDIPMHTHQVRPRTASHVTSQLSSSNAQKSSTSVMNNLSNNNCCGSSNIGGLLLRDVYSEVAYNDLKMKKIDQVRDVLWSHFVNSCVANVNDYEAYVNKLCKQNQIFF